VTPPAVPWFRFGAAVAILTLAFAWPLTDLVQFAFGGGDALPIEIANLYTHIILIPFIAVYLGWLRWTDPDRPPSSTAALPFHRPAALSEPPATPDPISRATAIRYPLSLLRPSDYGGRAAIRTSGSTCRIPLARTPAVVFAALSLLLLGVALVFGRDASGLSRNDWLTLTTLAWVSALASAGSWFLGAAVMRHLAFAFAFMLLVVPMPSFLIHAINEANQHASAEAAYWLINLTGTAIFRDGLIFHLPGITMQVAEECSGIRSSLVLFITSLIAGEMFLRRPWKKVVLTLFVLPLAILRNGFRILSIAMLCVHVDPEMIHHWIHHRGGPIFFALSLVPFFLLLMGLRRGERRIADSG